jgi:hypothetical protein
VLCIKSFKFYYLPYNKDCVKEKIVLRQTEGRRARGTNQLSSTLASIPQPSSHLWSGPIYDSSKTEKIDPRALQKLF